MKKTLYIAIATISFLFSCDNSSSNDETVNPCTIDEQGFTYLSDYNSNQNFYINDSELIVEYVTGNPQGDYYHIYSTVNPFLDFYSYGVTTGSTTVVAQTFNNTDGSYLTIYGSPFPQGSTTTITTTLGGSQVGDTIKLELSGFINGEGGGNYTGEWCVTIDKVINFAKYAYITDGANLKVIDLTNPIAPAVVQTIATNTSYYVAVVSSIAYVGYFDATAPFVSFVNIANPPTAHIIGTIAKGPDYGRVSDIIQADNYTYISDEYKGLHILEMSTNTYNRFSTTDAMSMASIGTDMFMIDQNKELHKYDITMASTPTDINVNIISAVDVASYPHSTGSFHSWVETSNNIVLTASISDTKLKKYDATTLTELADINIGGYATAIAIAGNYAFVTMKPSTDAPLQTSFDGVKMINIANNMSIIDTKPLTNTSGVVVNGNYVYVTDDNGMHIYDTSGANLSLISTFNAGAGNYIALGQ